jgi:hypothetical protein
VAASVTVRRRPSKGCDEVIERGNALTGIERVRAFFGDPRVKYAA